MADGTFRAYARAISRGCIALAYAMLMTAPMASDPTWAAGAYAVDDSDITDPGKCEVDSWVSSSVSRHVSANTNPTCGVPFAFPLEISAQITRANAAGSWTTTAQPQLKVNFVPSGVGAIGVGIAGIVTYDFIDRQTSGAEIYVPVTLTPNKDLRINLNLGWLYDQPTNLNWVTWGVSAELSVTDIVTLIGEVYVQSGHAIRPASTAWPRVQTGIRFTPRESFDIDVIYGRNINGENRNWFTLGLNLRF